MCNFYRLNIYIKLCDEGHHKMFVQRDIGSIGLKLNELCQLQSLLLNVARTVAYGQLLN